MFYVIGTYSDGLHHVLGAYPTLSDAQGAIRWQGQPRGELNWHDKAKTRGETWYSGGRFPKEKTQWTICKPSHDWGMFAPLDGGEVLKVSRGCYTAETFATICDTAYNSQIAF